MASTASFMIAMLIAAATTGGAAEIPITVGGFSFDPIAAGEPPAGTLESRSGGSSLYLVQLAEPPRDATIAALQSVGLSLLQYIPRHTYLVWAEASSIEAASRMALVRWQGSYRALYKIGPFPPTSTGSRALVNVVFVNDGAIGPTLTAIEIAGGTVLRHHPAQPDGVLHEAVVEIGAEDLSEIAAIPTVVWLESASAEPTLSDEMSDAVVAGRYEDGVPVLGYTDWLGNIGLDGGGVRWAVVDSGVDPFHPDLEVAAGVSYPGCETDEPGDDPGFVGHGTPVAGIIAGTGGGGLADPLGFRYGLGVAPGAMLVSQNALCGDQSAWPPGGGWQTLSRDGLANGAVGMNNSWNSSEGIAHGYQATERAFDLMVRDGDFDTAESAEPYFIVFSVHNDGPDPQTIQAPAEAKNIIAVGATQNARTNGDIDRVADFSGRGPAVDGRIVPTLVAPGEHVISAMHRDGGIFGVFEVPGTDGLYLDFTGTSAAAPHVSGAIALLTQWWRRSHAGADPSPAMAKALLVNGAVDVAGTPPIPNPDEGWGRIHLGNSLRPGVRVVHVDQTVVLDDTGDEWTLAVEVDDPSRPLKVTLAWTDAAGMPGANPALVNDLDLELTTGGRIYLGNVFVDGASVPDGDPDSINNLENVFVTSPGESAVISVRATLMAGDGLPSTGDLTDQDFALVCTNCRRPSPPPRRATGRVGGRP